MERLVLLCVQHRLALSRVGDILLPRGDGVVTITPAAVEHRVPQRIQPLVGGKIGEHHVGPALRRHAGDGLAGGACLAAENSAHNAVRDALRAHFFSRNALENLDVGAVQSNKTRLNRRIILGDRLVAVQHFRHLMVDARAVDKIALPDHTDAGSARAIGLVDDNRDKFGLLDRGFNADRLLLAQLEADLHEHFGIPPQSRFELHNTTSFLSVELSSNALRRSKAPWEREHRHRAR